MAPAAQTTDPAGFWSYSLACYGRADVAAACLDLQDRRGLDVNMLLFCCYAAAAHGLAMSVKEIRAFEARVSRWQGEVVEPLRAARRAVAAHADMMRPLGLGPVRAAIKAAELAAEEAEQACLQALLDGGGDRALSAGGAARGLAGHNLRAYLSGRGHALEPADVAMLDAILDGCFGRG